MTRTLTALMVLSFLFAAQPAAAQTYPRPYVSDISPKSVAPTAGSFTLMVRGTGLVNGVSQIYWNGTALAGTTCTAASAPNLASCSATVPVAKVVLSTAAVTVVNPGAGGVLLTSNTATLSVTTAVDPVFCEPDGSFDGIPTSNPCPYAWASAPTTPFDAITADFNGDGIADAVVLSNNGSWTAFLGDGNGRLTATASFVVGNGSAIAGDVDEDGRPDVVIVQNGSISVFHGNGDGTFTAGPVTQHSLNLGFGSAAADMNGDGHLDLVFASYPSSGSLVNTFLGDGQGHFSQAPGAFVSLLSANPALAIGDFDSDGIPDVAVTLNPNQMAILKGDGAGGFTQGATYTMDGAANETRKIASGDFNKDGVLDLAVSSGESVLIFPGDGTGGFPSVPSARLTASSGQVRQFQLADLDGDGNLDVEILPCPSICNPLVLFKGDGQGGFGAPVASALAFNHMAGFALADVNADGRFDVVFIDSLTNRLYAVRQFPIGLVSPGFLSFGDQPYLVPSTKTVTVTASGTAPLSLSSIAVTGAADFQVGGGTCGVATLMAPGTTCTVDVTFTPAVAGFPTGVLTVADNTRFSGASHDVDLAGSDVPNATLTYGSTNFGGQVIGSDNVLQVTLKSIGNGPVMLSVNAFNGTFDKGSCPVSPAVLTPGQSCDFYLHWVPQSRGASHAEFAVNNIAPGIPPQNLGVISPGGIGYSGAYSPSPGSLAFSPQGVNTSSAVKSVTVTNTAASPLYIYGLTIDAWPTVDFSIANTTTCPRNGSAVAPSASCHLDVIFTPTTKGDIFASLTIDTSAFAIPGSGPSLIDLSGAGLSNPLPFVSVPLAPSAIAPGAADLPLVVRGAGFVAGAVVRVNGAPLTTTFIDVDRLVATIPAAQIGAARTSKVTVFNPAPGGGVSNAADLPIATPVASVSLSRTDVTTGTAPEGVATGDFNGDGIPDLAVALCGSDRGTATPCPAGEVAILLGTGGGNFASPAVLTLPGSTADGIVAGDFNNDGKLDLVVSHWFSHAITLLKGDGAGNFAVSPDSPINLNWLTTVCSAGSLAAGDFNGDGSLDLVVVDANPDCGGQAFVFAGAGGTISQIPISQAYLGLAQRVAVGDFNGDGNLDLAGADSGSGFLFLAVGDGTGLLNWVDPIAGLTTPDGLVVADFNGDGKSDVAVADPGSASVTIFLGDGAAGFSPPQSFAVGNGPRSVSAVDFNNDGALDLVVANADDDTVTILLGDGAGHFTPNGPAQSVGARPLALVTADVDGDGRLDVVTVNRDDATVTVLRQRNASTTTTITAPSITYGANGVVTVRVSAAAGGVVSGSVSLTVDSGVPQSTALTNGAAIFTVVIPTVGSHSLSASFTAQNGLLASSSTGTLQVNGTATTTTIASHTPNPAAPGQVVTMGFVVTVASITSTAPAPSASAAPSTPPGAGPNGPSAPQPGVIVPQGSVTLTASTGETCSGTLSGGRGSCSMTFATLGARTVTASYAGSGNLAASTSAPITQTINGPVAVLTPNGADFGSLYLDDQVSRDFTLRNAGNAPLRVTDVAIVAPGNAVADFTRKPPACPPSLAPGATCTITITLAPRASGLRTATLRVTDDAGGSPHTAALSGTVVNPKANLAPGKLDFAKQKVGTVSAVKTVTLTNSGTTPLTIGALAMTGDFAGATGTTCAGGASLAPAASCTINVIFTPTAKGPRTGSLTVTNDAKNSPQTVALSGDGT